MSDFNQCILMGRLTRDVETRYLTKGTAVAQIGIAVTRKWTAEGGEKKEDTAFVDCEAFGRQAETMAQYLKKGSSIHIVGRLKTDTWDDKSSGQKRSKLKVVVESFQFIGSRDDKTEGTPAPVKAASSATKESAVIEPAESDDVPF